ncbi:hypothetical protein EK904_007570 [Melospiza melodia maxima]|nr:hypothetical protein EK904_007570 [Melospiza melodia maxima]
MEVTPHEYLMLGREAGGGTTDSCTASVHTTVYLTTSLPKSSVWIPQLCAIVMAQTTLPSLPLSHKFQETKAGSLCGNGQLFVLVLALNISCKAGLYAMSSSLGLPMRNAQHTLESCLVESNGKLLWSFVSATFFKLVQNTERKTNIRPNRECKITDQQQQQNKNNKPSLNPDRLCYSSVLSPRAGMRKYSTQLKNKHEIRKIYFYQTEKKNYKDPEPETSDMKDESLYITEEKEEWPESTCHCQYMHLFFSCIYFSKQQTFPQLCVRNLETKSVPHLFCGNVPPSHLTGAYFMHSKGSGLAVSNKPRVQQRACTGQPTLPCTISSPIASTLALLTPRRTPCAAVVRNSSVMFTHCFHLMTLTKSSKATSIKEGTILHCFIAFIHSKDRDRTLVVQLFAINCHATNAGRNTFIALGYGQVTEFAERHSVLASCNYCAAQQLRHLRTSDNLRVTSKTPANITVTSHTESQSQWQERTDSASLLSLAAVTCSGNKRRLPELKEANAIFSPSSAPSKMEGVLAENREERVRCHMHQTKEWELDVSSACGKKKSKYLQKENGCRILWKPFIIKMCSCRRREEQGLCERKQVPSKLHSDTVSISSGLCLLSDTEQTLHECDQENIMQNCTANANLHQKSDKPNYFSIPNGQRLLQGIVSIFLQETVISNQHPLKHSILKRKQIYAIYNLIILQKERKKEVATELCCDTYFFCVCERSQGNCYDPEKEKCACLRCRLSSPLLIPARMMPLLFFAAKVAISSDSGLKDLVLPINDICKNTRLTQVVIKGASLQTAMLDACPKEQGGCCCGGNHPWRKKTKLFLI